MDLGHGAEHEFVVVLSLCVESECKTWTGSSSSAWSMVGIGLADGGDIQSVHNNFGIVDFQYTKACIDDIPDTIYREGCSMDDDRVGDNML